MTLLQSLPSFNLQTVIAYLLLPSATLYLAYPVMTTLLQTLMAAPRIRHASNLDLCYVSQTAPIIIAMSVPAHTFPRIFYRNNLTDVLNFLDQTHGRENWAIWEFRAEGAGYPDEAFHGQINHAPFPDHHPPPFALVPKVVASMRNHLLQGEEKVVVVHCKAGKGRSGTMSCAFLIAENGFSADEALAQFTAARMRPGFGEGVSIPSQQRWVRYIEQWTRQHNKRYIEQRVQIQQVHVWGLRSGVKVAVQGYVDSGKMIKTYHTFHKSERVQMSTDEKTGSINVIFEPKEPLILPNNDVNIDFERRTKERYGMAMVTSIGHVWWNAYFEGKGPDKSGVFEITWDEMDGIKGTYRKGLQTLDKLQIVWNIVNEVGSVDEPPVGEEVVLTSPAPAKQMQEQERRLGAVVEEEEESSSSGSPTTDDSLQDARKSHLGEIKKGKTV